MLRLWLFLLVFCSYFQALFSSTLQLLSTESDPDAFVQECVNVINGNYCEVATDLIINGPDSLLLQRFYSSIDDGIGNQRNVWSLFPQRFLVIGKDSSKVWSAGKVRMKAFVGERSGGILPYSGWRNSRELADDPLKIDENSALGMVNTYAEEINGQTNHQNNRLYYRGDKCEMTLGDGTKRIYQKV